MKKTLELSRFQRLAKEGSWIIGGQIASVLASLVLVRVLTEYLSPTQYGQLALGLTVAGLVNQVVMGGVINGIMRYYSIADEANDLPAYLKASCSLIGYATTVVVVIALFLIVGLVWFRYTEWIGLAAAALVFSLLSGYNSALNSIQSAARQRGVVAFHSSMDAWLKILLAVAVMLWLGHSGTAVVIGYALSSLIITGSQFFFLRQGLIPDTRCPKAQKQWSHQIWAYSWPFSTWGIFTWMQQVSDRWALESFSTTKDVGMYSVVFQLGYSPIGMATGLLMSFLAPILFQRSGDATDSIRNASVHKIVWRTTFVGLVITVLAFCFTYVFHGWIFTQLVATQYHPVSYLLPYVIFAGSLFAAGQMLSIKLVSELKSTSILIAKIITALLGISMNIYGAAQFGLRGVVASLVAFSCIYFLWMAWLSRNSLST